MDSEAEEVVAEVVDSVVAEVVDSEVAEEVDSVEEEVAEEVADSEEEVAEVDTPVWLPTRETSFLSKETDRCCELDLL